MNLNTLLAPVYWELIEPAEDKFDFELYDRLIEKARTHNLKLILLWFGSWKNSMSSH
ncbi:MAG: beta-galactosidase, partial [Calditrichota bacterium]